jgi:hypothetical protein
MKPPGPTDRGLRNHLSLVTKKNDHQGENGAHKPA